MVKGSWMLLPVHNKTFYQYLLFIDCVYLTRLLNTVLQLDSLIFLLNALALLFMEQGILIRYSLFTIHSRTIYRYSCIQNRISLRILMHFLGIVPSVCARLYQPIWIQIQHKICVLFVLNLTFVKIKNLKSIKNKVKLAEN